MKKSTFGIFGLGKAGGSLCASLVHAGFDVVAYTRRPARARQLGRCFNQRLQATTSLPLFLRHLQSAHAKILFICTKDFAIEPTAHMLENQAWLPKSVVHFSGAQSPRTLENLSSMAQTGVFHPLASLDGSTQIPHHALAAICTDSPSLRKQLTALAKKIHLNPVVIQESEQIIYHAAAVMTANLPIALVDESLQLMKQANIPSKMAQVALAGLLRTVAENLERNSIKHALTGPIARGDSSIVEQHLSALKKIKTPYTLAIYRLLSQRLLELAPSSDISSLL